VKHDEAALQRAADWAGIRLSPPQLALLTAYADWLIAEAIPAGAVGPAESSRIIDRHVADSLVFGAAWVERPPETLIDVGTGVGLPGIPLAIAFPRTAVTLLDRSQRRIDLTRRVINILRLPNADTVHGPVETHSIRFGAAVFRGSLPPSEALIAARTLLKPGGVAVIGLHRGPQRPAAVHTSETGELLTILETPDGVLDSPAWLLRMTVT
jgi:16S rRNA (guanine527-N7)-methyltransferase